MTALCSRMLCFWLVTRIGEASLMNTAKTVTRKGIRQMIRSSSLTTGLRNDIGAEESARDNAGAAPKNNPATEDSTATCFHAIMTDRSEEFAEYIDGVYWEDDAFCDLFDDISRNWANGCEGLFADLKHLGPRSTCVAAEMCHRDLIQPSRIHGACVKQCKNTNTTVECQHPSLELSGLTHPRVCPEIIPLELMMEVQGFTGSYSTIIYACCNLALNLIFDVLSRDNYEKEQMKTPTGLDTLHVLFQCCTLLLIWKRVYGVLKDAGGICRFVVLAAPFSFGPYVSAFMLLTPMPVQLFLYMQSLAGFPEFREKFWEKSHLWRLKMITIFIECAFIVLLVVVNILFILPITIASFWGVFAYVHIVIVIALTVAMTLAPLVCIAKCGAIENGIQAALNVKDKVTQVFSKKDSNDDLEGKGEEMADELKELHLPLIAFLLGSLLTLQFCSFMFSHTFLLYIHGEWMPFHESFFDSFFEVPSLPKFSLWIEPSFALEAAWDILMQDSRSSVETMFTMSVSASVIVTTLKGLHFVYRKMNEEKDQAVPRTSYEVVNAGEHKVNGEYHIVQGKPSFGKGYYWLKQSGGDHRLYFGWSIDSAADGWCIDSATESENTLYYSPGKSNAPPLSGWESVLGKAPAPVLREAAVFGLCDECGKELLVGVDWFHKPNSEDDLCIAHYQELPENQRALYIYIEATSQLGDELYGYATKVTKEGHTSEAWPE